MVKWIVLMALTVASSTQAFALIGGEAATTFPEVVKLQAGKKVCTGTIIGPRTILSAAHCATLAEDKPHFLYNGKTYSVTYLASSKQADGHDLALAITKEPIKDAHFARLGRGLSHGAKITMAGYGCTKKGGVPGPLHVGITRVIGMDQDHILSASKDGGVLCEGDSGGPSFLTEDGVRRLVAVSSLSDISKININVRTDSDVSYAFFKLAAESKNIEICGINAPCD